MASRTSSLKTDQRRFRIFLWLVATTSLTLLVGVITVYQTHQPPAEPLLTATQDAVVHDVLAALLGTVLGSSLIGILLDQYQSQFGGRAKEYDDFLLGEGLIAVFGSSAEPRLLTALEEAVDEARVEIVGVGLGLSVLMNRVLLMKIAQRLADEASLKVTVLLGGSDNAGVMNRVAEEQAWHNTNKIAYDPTWVDYFPREIRTILELHAGESNRDRVTVKQIPSCPTVGVLRIDKRAFLFLYGAPSMRGGSESPWIELDTAQKDGRLNKFVDRYVAHFVRESEAVAEVTKNDPPRGTP